MEAGRFYASRLFFRSQLIFYIPEHQGVFLVGMHFPSMALGSGGIGLVLGA